MSIENSVVFFPCKDIKETSKFYQEVVGLKLVQVQDSGNECHIFDTGYGYIGFCHYPDGRPIPSGPVGMCISFNCHDEADVDAHYEVLKAKGADVEGMDPKMIIAAYYENFPKAKDREMAIKT